MLCLQELEQAEQLLLEQMLQEHDEAEEQASGEFGADSAPPLTLGEIIMDTSRSGAAHTSSHIQQTTAADATKLWPDFMGERFC